MYVLTMGKYYATMIQIYNLNIYVYLDYYIHLDMYIYTNNSNYSFLHLFIPVSD